METLALIVVAAAILGFGLVSGRLEKSVVTAPMAFVALGLLAGALGWVEMEAEHGLVHFLAEITLVVVLFTDASRIDLGRLRREHDLPVRMLAIGMPLTIALGALAGALLLPGLSLWEAALLAAILAPTDAALGQAVVSSPRVPVRIRQALNVESGLNDGIALPLVLVLFSVACAVEQSQSLTYWLGFAALQVTLGPLVGVAVGALGGRAVDRAVRRGWMSHAFQDLSALGLALLAFAGAEAIGGNGFIAAFCAGLALGNLTGASCSRLYEFGEAEGQLLALLVFLVFGATLAPEALHHVSGATVLYALLSLTLVRLLPVAISLIGEKLRFETVLFLGWFGPRGIASILFALLVIERAGGEVHGELIPIVMLTVLLSVFAHGVTAYPGSSWYARRLEAARGEEPAPEHREVSEMPLRLPAASRPE